MLAFFLKGLLLGLAAGASPGPLTTLVIAETLRHKTQAGLKVAIAPLLTDAPIIVVCFFLLKRFIGTPRLLGLIAIIGALYVLWLGISNLRLREFFVESPAAGQSLRKGIITNFLNPHPWLFWMTVGSTIMVMALETHPLALVLFLLGFYACLVGAKVVLALLVGKSRSYLSSRVFLLINKVLGMLLILFAGLLFYDGVKFLLN